MSDVRTATVRTTVPAVWVSLLLFVGAKAGWDLSDADWQVVMLVAPLVTGVVYRAGRELEARWPSVGRVLFGSSRRPSYD
jgi:hypothetical protein